MGVSAVGLSNTSYPNAYFVQPSRISQRQSTAKDYRATSRPTTFEARSIGLPPTTRLVFTRCFTTLTIFLSSSATATSTPQSYSSPLLLSSVYYVLFMPEDYLIILLVVALTRASESLSGAL